MHTLLGPCIQIAMADFGQDWMRIIVYLPVSKLALSTQSPVHRGLHHISIQALLGLEHAFIVSLRPSLYTKAFQHQHSMNLVPRRLSSSSVLCRQGQPIHKHCAHPSPS